MAKFVFEATTICTVSEVIIAAREVLARHNHHHIKHGSEEYTFRDGISLDFHVKNDVLHEGQRLEFRVLPKGASAEDEANLQDLDVSMHDGQYHIGMCFIK